MRPLRSRPDPVELIAKLRGEFGIEYAESYGLTETSPVITTAPYALTKPGSCGKAMGDTELQVVSADGRVLGTGEIGELWACGTAIMLGYWRRPDVTAEAITPDGWFKTGDIVRMDSDGYIYIVDRQKDMINVAGEKVYPRKLRRFSTDTRRLETRRWWASRIQTKVRRPKRISW